MGDSLGPRDIRLAREIARRHALAAEDILPIVGHGSVNHVWVTGSGPARSVIRFAIDPLRNNELEAEAWCLNKAASVGIPSPQVIAQGCLKGVPYLIETFVRGIPGNELRSPGLWTTLGRYARKVHSIALTDDAPAALFSRFGRELRDAWKAHLGYNVAQLTPADPLIALGVYQTGEQERLRAALLELNDADLAFGLSHGDLSPRNLVVADTGDPVLIDWGSGSAGPLPFGDLLPAVRAHRLIDDPSSAELEALAVGLGVRLDEIRITLERLLLLDALDLVRWAIDQRPDRLHDTIASARAHLQSQSQGGGQHHAGTGDHAAHPE